MLRLCPCVPFSYWRHPKRQIDFFNLPPPTTAHTIRDSDRHREDGQLHKAKVNHVDEEQTSPPFTDPVESGWIKLRTTDWLKNALARNLADDNADLEQIEELDLDYELADMV